MSRNTQNLTRNLKEGKKLDNPTMKFPWQQQGEACLVPVITRHKVLKPRTFIQNRLHFANMYFTPTVPNESGQHKVIEFIKGMQNAMIS